MGNNPILEMFKVALLAIIAIAIIWFGAQTVTVLKTQTPYIFSISEILEDAEIIIQQDLIPQYEYIFEETV